MFKNRLQELAQRHCLSLPEYKSIKDGPDHAPRFKAIVTYNGRTFESPALCRTAKEAQNAAAEFALDVLLGRADQRPKQTNGPLPVQTQLVVTSSNSNIEAKKEHREDVMPIALANSEMNDGTLQQLHDGSSSSRSGMGSVPANDQKEDKRLQQPQDRSYSSVSSMVNMLENSKKTDKTLLKPQDGPAASQSLPISRVQRIVPSDGISTSETSRSNVSSRSEISQNGTGKEQGHDIAVSVLERRQWNEETSKQSDSRSSPSQLLAVQTQLGVTSSNSNIEAKKEHKEDVMPIALANSEMNDGTLQQFHDGSSSSQSGMVSVPANDQKEDKRLQQPQDRSYSAVSSMVSMLENSKKMDKTLLKPQDESAAPQSLPISRVQRIVPSDGISTSETSRSNVSSRSEISQNGTGKEQVHDIAVSVLERRQWNEETSKQSDSRSSPSQLLSDMHKNQLQDLAFRGGFSLPSYSSVRKGPAHVPLFKAFVTFEGETYESPEFYGTLRQAEHAAAAVALKSLTKKGFSLNESAMYKNFLQEFAQKEGIPFPEYMTDRSGPSHISIFKSTVKFAGLAFVGKEANSKKQAEKNAAMAAWSALKDGRSLSVSTRKTSDNGEKEADHEPNVNIQQSRGHLVSHLNKSLSAFSLTDSPDSEDTDKGKKKELEQNMAASTLTCKDKDTVQQLHSIPLHKQFPSGTTIRVVPQSGPVSGTGPHIRNNTWVAMNLTDNAMQNKHNST